MSLALTDGAAAVLQQLLVDLGMGSLRASNAAWPIAVGSEAPDPDDVITLYNTTGKTEGCAMFDGEVQEHLGVQVRVRGKDYDTGHAKVSAVARSLAEQVLNEAVTVSTRTYIVHAVRRSGGIVDLGRETGSRRHLFTLNVLAAVRRNT